MRILQKLQMLVFEVLIDFAIAAFLLNLIREIVKDVEDIQGDHVARYKTLPVLLGAQRVCSYYFCFRIIHAHTYLLVYIYLFV